MTRSALSVVFAGGGTGGHLFPGLAVAEQLRQFCPQLQVAFAGSGSQWEREQVAQGGYEYLTVPSRPWPRRRGSTGSFLLQNTLGYCAALRFLQRRHVGVVVGLGGYASAPTARAALTCGIPLVLLEQNAFPGKVNRWLAPHAALVCAAFAESEARLRSRGAFCLTGNPVRLAAAHVPQGERQQELIIVGGSRGSRSLNLHAPQAVANAKLQLSGWNILHQTGQAGAVETQRLYESLGLEAKVVPFIADLPQALARCRLALCRAGGSTLAELAIAGTPAVLCPLPHAADDHQRKNAASFAAAGACLVVDEQRPPGFLSERLASAITLLANDQALWRQSSAAMLQLARPLAARQIAELILERVRPQLRV